MSILLVEDENSIREVTAAYLKQSGYNVVEADNGDDALRLYKKNKPDLVILDINIPGPDGLSVAKTIRTRSTVPIIMLTARVQDIDELIGFEAGADDYVKKPFSPAVLVARIKNLLRRSPEEKIENKYLTVEPQKMRATALGKKIELTTTEFNILKLLAATPGKVFTRNEIIDKAMSGDLDAYILDRTIDAHIKNIRQKLAVSGKMPELILTVIGTGYKFNDETDS